MDGSISVKIWESKFYTPGLSCRWFILGWGENDSVNWPHLQNCKLLIFDRYIEKSSSTCQASLLTISFYFPERCCGGAGGDGWGEGEQILLTTTKRREGSKEKWGPEGLAGHQQHYSENFWSPRFSRSVKGQPEKNLKNSRSQWFQTGNNTSTESEKKITSHQSHIFL